MQTKKFSAARLILWFTLLLLLLCTVFTVGFAVWAVSVPERDLEEALFSIGVTDRTTRLYYYGENGEAIELTSDRISGFENALYCPLEEMPNELVNAFIAIEDKRFYSHGGVDYLRTLSAVRNYLLGGDKSFGGSTITQQLIKNLTGDTDRSVARKVGEMMRAASLERKLSKHDILEQYLNVVNLAEGCYGVKTAANAYFSKEPAALTLAECATIAAITNNPTKYDPIRHPEANKVRRDTILAEMLAQDMITPREYRIAIATEIALNVDRSAMNGRVNSWYADLAVNDVIKALVKEKGYTEAEASRLLYCGGLKIYLPMQRELQRVVEEYYLSYENFPVHENGEQAQSALMIVDQKNGDLLAVAGAVGAKTSNRVQNFATDARRPSGSVIKPLSVYAPALERNLITYATVFDDIPLSFRENGAPWPHNSPNVYRGLTNVNAALTESVNTVAVSVLKRLGNAAAYRFLTADLGFTSLQGEADMGAAALALGQQYRGVTLRELLGGYTALANRGVFEEVRSYLLVLDSKGEVLLENKPSDKRVIGEDTASIMTLMLRHAVRDGTGKALSLKNTLDVAGKTGTSSHNCDKWFIGYTPELLCGVWYGYEYPKSVSDVPGNHALHIFDAVMTRATEIYGGGEKQFKTADGVVAARYCRDSGQLLGENCCLDARGDRSEIGYFKKGTEPHATCCTHVAVDYCRCGGVASAACPTETCYKVSLLRVSRRFPRQIKVLDAPYSYGGAPSQKELDLSYNKPYYADNCETKQNYGVGIDVVPFNHICPVHTEDHFWQRRFEE